MFTRIKTTQINDHLWLFNDNNESTGYLVTGTDKALIIDTMNGLVDVHALARIYTDLPLMVVNTHGHFDHILGNIYFDQVYLNHKDHPLVRNLFKHPKFQEYITKHHLAPASFLDIIEGTTIDLGGIQLEVFETPGHTPGGICLLDRKDRILFSGDTIIPQCWMQMEESLSIDTMIASLEHLGSIRNEFDHILHGHCRDVEDGSLYEDLLQAFYDLRDGKTENDYEYPWFGGVSMAHPYGEEPRKIAYKKKQVKTKILRIDAIDNIEQKDE